MMSVWLLVTGDFIVSPFLEFYGNTHKSKTEKLKQMENKHTIVYVITFIVNNIYHDTTEDDLIYK